MNFLAWNCRGTASKGFPTLIKDIKRRYEASLVFLIETHANGDNMLKTVKKLGFTSQYC